MITKEERKENTDRHDKSNRHMNQDYWTSRILIVLSLAVGTIISITYQEQRDTTKAVIQLTEEVKSFKESVKERLTRLEDTAYNGKK